MKLLFVCLGNICRSPMAAAIMKHICTEQKIKAVIDSAGTEDWNVGDCADRRARTACLSNGVDLSRHRARQLQRQDFDRFDLIIVMDKKIEQKVRRLAPPTVRHKIRHILGIDNNNSEDINDPYNEPDEAFLQLFDVLNKACLKIFKHLQSN